LELFPHEYKKNLFALLRDVLGVAVHPQEHDQGVEQVTALKGGQGWGGGAGGLAWSNRHCEAFFSTATVQWQLVPTRRWPRKREWWEGGVMLGGRLYITPFQ